LNLLFAWRYFRSKKSTNAINVIAWISVTAIAVGSAALIIVLSVFNGFEDLVKGLYADFYADIRIAPARGKTIRFDSTQLAALRQTPGVAAYSLVAEEKAVLNGAFQTIITLKGVDAGYERVTNINTKQHLVQGTYSLGTVDAPELVVGSGIENAAGIDVQRQFPLTIYLPNKQATRLISEDGLHSNNMIPSGVFVVQQEFDNKYAFTNLGFVKYMLSMAADEYSAVEIKTNADADQLKKTLAARLGEQYKIETRYEQNRSLYSVMQVEKWVIYGILCLILVVAAFNMIGALTMLVLEKQKDIAVLKAMGASEQKLQTIFLGEGMLLAGLGGSAGILLAGLFCWLQLHFKLIKLGGNTFIIDYYPVKMLPGDFLLVIATIFVIAILAAWIPSRKASLQPFSLKS
jgi:lipoprotein-releasing system permease protein